MWLPAAHGWGELSIEATSTGPYAYLKLQQYGNSIDSVDFVMVNSNGEEVSDRGVAREGSSTTTRVNYHNGDSERYVRGVSMRSNHWNFSGYDVKGYVIY